MTAIIFQKLATLWKNAFFFKLKKVKKITIAVDGHSSCGKSTLAKDLAKALDYLYIDSGAMYRAVTLFFIQNEVVFNDPVAVESALAEIEIHFKSNEKGLRTFLNGKEVEEEIRSMVVSKQVSEASTISAVRKKMVEQQRKLGKAKGIVMDGRDIGTVVFPDAELKIFLTASPEIRAKRRYDELKQKGIETPFEEVLENIKHRDHIDSTRDDSPLKKASDAKIIDNSHLSRSEQLEKALQLAKSLL